VTIAQAMLVLKALTMLIPFVVEAVRNGKIRAASQQEVLDVVAAKIKERADRARSARDDPNAPDGLSDSER
jgi:hypothetical protein